MIKLNVNKKNYDFYSQTSFVINFSIIFLSRTYVKACHYDNLLLCVIEAWIERNKGKKEAQAENQEKLKKRGYDGSFVSGGTLANQAAKLAASPPPPPPPSQVRQYDISITSDHSEKAIVSLLCQFCLW